jgi:hypothetical protein
MKWSLILKDLEVKSLRIDDLAAIRWFSLSKIVVKDRSKVGIWRLSSHLPRRAHF